MQPFVHKTVGASDVIGISNVGEVDHDITMAAGKFYLFVADQDCWIAQGTAPVAAAKADGSWFAAKGTEKLLAGQDGPKLSVLGTAVGGFSCIAECRLA